MSDSSTIKTKVRAWGSSYGIIIPSEVIKNEGINEGDEIIIEVRKQRSIKEIFGSLKDRKINTQKTKDELRKEWSKW